MILEPCLECKHLEVLECGNGRCLKEKCLAIYSKCIQQKALDFYIEHNSRES